LRIVALKRNEDPITIIPQPATQVRGGDLLVVIGDRASLEALGKAE
jgi:Trk K+ transport system NAD-binding subunit